MRNEDIAMTIMGLGMGGMLAFMLMNREERGESFMPQIQLPQMPQTLTPISIIIPQNLPAPTIPQSLIQTPQIKQLDFVPKISFNSENLKEDIKEKTENLKEKIKENAEKIKENLPQLPEAKPEPKKIFKLSLPEVKLPELPPFPWSQAKEQAKEKIADIGAKATLIGTAGALAVGLPRPIIFSHIIKKFWLERMHENLSKIKFYR